MKTLEVNQIIDNARFTRFHWMVMCLCGLLLIFDGYDLFIYGAVLPVLMKEWGLTPVQAGALGSYALFGMMFGAFVFGPLADRIGRKKGVALSFVLFSVATFLCGFATSPTEFGIYRFIAGLGCGGLMPNAVALMNEYAPKRARSTLGRHHVQWLLAGRRAVRGPGHLHAAALWLAIHVLCLRRAVGTVAPHSVETARVRGFPAAHGPGSQGA